MLHEPATAHQQRTNCRTARLRFEHGSQHVVEFPTASADRSARFFSEAFAWPGTNYGPDYVDIGALGIPLGFQADVTQAPPGPLVVIEVSDLDDGRDRVERAGAVVTVEPFDFPGGRRLHFREPGGNELAIWVRR